MPFPSLDFINSIRPQVRVVDVPDFVTLRDLMLNDLHERIPAWAGYAQPDDILYKMVEYYADREISTKTEFNETFIQGFLAYATGANLDARAYDYGQSRDINETDDSLREKCARSLQGISAGRVAGIVLIAMQNPNYTVFDVSVKERPNQQDLDLYFTTRPLTLPDSAEIQVMQDWFDNALDDDHDPIGSTIFVTQASIETYTLGIQVLYDPSKADRQVLYETVVRNLTDFIEAKAKLNRSINAAGIHDAVYIIDDTRDVKIPLFVLDGDGGVAGTWITNGGTGYTADLTVTFSAPANGTRAEGTAKVADGKVVSIEVTNPGTGYTSPPTITIPQITNFTGATAESFIGTAVTELILDPGKIRNCPNSQVRIEMVPVE